MTRTHVLHPDIKSPRRDDARPAARSLEEAVGLAAAIDLEVAGSDVVPLPKAHPGHLFGSGKVEELGERFKEGEIELVVIDGPVTPVQQRNLEKAWKVKILDRTGLILEIFGERARTREGVLQVELAHLNYAKTRLVRSWTHLERQRGGLGFVGGPGETQIEADRRALSDRIKKIERRLETVVKTRELHRGARRKIPYPIVALVGYTNAGKSTLFNRLTRSDVFAKDLLFATLDPTLRRVALPHGREIILSDTVGFISDLPTHLIAAFRATLEEVTEADLVLHVRDIAHEDTQAQAADVTTTLELLGLGDDRDVTIVEVWNKIDLLAPERRDGLLAANGAAKDAVAVSAVTGAGMDDLLARIELELSAGSVVFDVSLPADDGEAIAWLHRNTDVLSREDEEMLCHFRIRVAERRKGEVMQRFRGRLDPVAEPAAT